MSPWQQARTSTLPLGEVTRNESKSQDMSSVIFRFERFGEDISRIVNARDTDKLDQSFLNGFMNGVCANAGVFRPLLHVE